MYCESSNAHAQEIKAAPHSGSSDWTLTLPGAPPSVSGQSLTATTAGVASWAAGGKVVQWVYADYGSQQTTTSDSLVDLPNLSVSITLTNSSNKVLILGSLNGLYKNTSGATKQGLVFQLLRDATAVAGFGEYNAAFELTSVTTTNLPIVYQDNPADTSAHTYKFQWKRRYNDSAASIYMNFNDAVGNVSTIMALEIAA